MTVAELIEKLKALPQDSLVVLSNDDEGNGHREANDVEGGAWWSDDDAEVVEDGYQGAAPCVVLW